MLFVLLAAATAWLCALMPVFAQEAYYWTYARHPALSYFDHPPMVAWSIWLGTSLFGDGAFGVRFGAWACGLLATWFGLLLLRDFRVDRTGQCVWIVLGVASPILAMTHWLSNPDAMLVCCWTLTMWALWRARGGGLGWWLLAGAAAGMALVSKYTAIFLGLSGILLLMVDPSMRRQWRRSGPWLGVLVAVIVFSPVIIWNCQNHFESFRFQSSDRFANADFGVRRLLELIGGQIAVGHPVLAALLPFSLVWLLRRAGERDPRAAWLLAFGLPLAVYLLVSSLWIQVKLNWLAPAHVPLLLGLVVWWRESRSALIHPRLTRVALLTLLFVPLAVPLLPLIRLVPPGKGSTWAGWPQIAERAEIWEDRIDVQDGIEGNVFFFGADYRDSAQLGRNLVLFWRTEPEHQVVAGSPDRGEPTLAQNVIGQHGLQFDHWDAPMDRIGQDAIFVLPRPEQRPDMVTAAAAHFDHIDKVERVDVTRLGIHLYDADIYVCHHYRGPKQ